MNIAGIIAEYNPFHSGHAYHIEQTRAQCKADAVVCLMSASFVQRGQPACYDKFARTRMALLNGADLVLELPTFLALQSAEYFAQGAVFLLEHAGIINTLSFGVEQPFSPTDVDPLARRKLLDAGQPYAKAMGSTLAPNALLGQEYMRALTRCQSRIEPVQILRKGAGHDSLEGGEHLSATAIRQRLATGQSCAPYFNGCDAAFLAPDAMFTPLLAHLRRMSLAELSDISQVSEGLEYKIKEAAAKASNLSELILLCKSKRYTFSRLARILCCAFLGITQEMTNTANAGFPYLRVLGVKKEKRELLSMLTAKAKLPVVTNCADFKKTAPSAALPLFEKECLATDLRAALVPSKAGSDFTSGFIFTK